MKKSTIKLLGAGLLVGTLFVVSCKKDNLTKDEALQKEADLRDRSSRVNDSLLKAGGIIRYSVLVYAANTASGKKEKTNGLQGATVTLDQNGKITTMTTDASGLAAFPDCRIGNVVVVVSMAGHTTLNYKTSLDPGSNSGINSSTVRNVSTLAPVFSTTGATSTATLKGVATFESDLTNRTSEPVPAGTVVSAYIDAQSSTFRNNYFNDQYNYTNDGAGHIEQANYETALATTTTDASGNYSLSVPAAVNELPVTIYFADITATQTLVFRNYYNEPQPATWAFVRTVRTTFSQSFTGNSNGEFTQIPGYQAVVGTVSAPPAQGSGAAVNLKFRAQSAQGATGGLTVVQTGTLTPGTYAVTVSGGSFDANLTTPSVSTPASLTIVVAANGFASITGGYGYGYRSQPTFAVAYSGTNSLTLGFNDPNSQWTSQVANFNIGSTTFNDGNAGSTISAAGSGYMVPPSARWILSGTYTYQTSSTDILNGLVVSVGLPGFGNISTLPTVVLEPVAPVTAIIGDVYINNDGSVNYFNFEDNGQGYNTQAGVDGPTITLTSLIPGYTPTPPIISTYVNSGDGSISSYNFPYNGTGYPTGSANTPTSFMPFSINNSASSLTVNVKPGSTYIRDVYYGTGYHAIGVD